MPLVTVILPVYNGCEYIKETVASILGQSYTQFELIIIDDGSTDSTAQLVSGFSDIRISYHYQSNQGISCAINKALDLSKGDLIAHCDADDLWHKHKLEAQVNLMTRRDDIVLSGTWAWIINKYGKRIGEHRHVCDTELIALKLIYDNPFVHSSIIYRRSVALRIGGYRLDADVNPPEDYDFVSRMALVGHTQNLNAFLTTYRHHSLGISKRSFQVLQHNKVSIAAAYLSALDRRSPSTVAVRRSSIDNKSKQLTVIQYYGKIIDVYISRKAAGNHATFKSDSYFIWLLLRDLVKSIFHSSS